MKTTYKVLILCVSIILAVGAVMIYAKTSVTPPGGAPTIDRYGENLAGTHKQLARNAADSLFDEIVCRAVIFHQEEKITDGAYDSTINATMGAYAGPYVEKCLGHFQQSVWSDGVINSMGTRFRELENVRLADGSSALTGEQKARIARANGIIGRYHRALAVCSQTGFRGIPAARSAISEANSLAADPVLKHNTSLVSNLRGVRAAIGNAHYRWLEGRVNGMAHLYGSALEARADAVQSDLDEYRRNASSLYGSARDISPLIRKAENIISNAYGEAAAAAPACDAAKR